MFFYLFRVQKTNKLMPNITLPDGKKLNFDKSVTGSEVAEKISKSLAKQALVMSVNGELKDLYSTIDLSLIHISEPTRPY